MELYDWALYTHTKGAVKPHTLLDFMTFLPEYVYITDGKGADNTSAWNVRVMPLSFVVADRAYCDFGLLGHWDSSGVTFVVRHKDNLLYRTVGERDLPPVGHQDVPNDEIIELTGTGTAQKYPERLRRVAVYNEESNSVVQLLTNDFKLAASTIAAPNHPVDVSSFLGGVGRFLNRSAEKRPPEVSLALPTPRSTFYPLREESPVDFR